MDKQDASNAGIGLAIGAGFGLAIGTVTGNIALWMPIGAVLGLIFGGYWKSLTRQDKSRKDIVK
jgi:hypothetical protein